MKFKKILSGIISGVTAVSLVMGSASISSSAVTHTSVHDPSVIKLSDGSYYIIGSHLAAARSTDLMNWKTTANSDQGTKNTTYFSDIYTDLAVPNSWSDTTDGYDLSGNLWAPDIVYNPVMKKYCMYLSVNGANWNSSIVLCTADDIDGPYTFSDTVVFSGFTNNTTNNVKDTDVYKVLGDNADISRYLSDGSWNASYGTNAIDPCVFYDENGALHMIYGSWFGGLYMLDLDENTGKRDYTVTYETKTDVSDAYMGKKIGGGYFSSGEGPYIEYMKSPNSSKGYYYLFTSYGYFNANGGYNMRVFRSENPDGPYVDENGNSAIYKKWTDDTTGTTGERLMSNYKWNCNTQSYRAEGHNSALMDDDGRLFLIYHTKFDDSNGFHEVRVHQMFINEDGWLTVAPYEYTGETISETGYSQKSVTGEYEFIFHTLNQAYVNETSSDVETSKTINLNEDGTVTGDVTGTWTMEDNSPNMTFTYNGVTYKGEFLVQKDESAAQVEKMTFTATSNNTCVWGSKNAEYNEEDDGIDLTDYNSKITYNAEISSYENGNLKIGDTDLFSDIPYTIESKSSGLVLDVPNGNTAEGTAVQQWESNGLSAQQWRFVDLGDGYCKIVSMINENMALTIESGDATNGSKLILKTYSNLDSQKFKLVSETGGCYGIKSKCSNDTAGLDVFGWSTENGGTIDQWEYWSGDCELWKIKAVYSKAVTASYIIKNINSEMTLGYSDSNVIQDANKSVWNVTENADGTYTIANANNQYLTVENSDATDGNNISLMKKSDSKNQNFKIQSCKDGSYKILSECSNYTSCLDVYNISKDSGANICQWNYWGGDGQKWILIPVKAEIKADENIVGDINADSVADSKDITTMQEYILKRDTFTQEEFTSADLNGDGKVNAIDLAILKGLIK